MAELLKPDICVIGAGAGGLSVAAAAAAFGVPVVLVEKDRMGGECLNAGCVPSKALLAAARRAHAIEGAGVFGVSTTERAIDFARVHEHVHGVIAAIAPNDSQRALHRPRRARDRGNGALHRSGHGRGRRRHRDQGAALRDRGGLIAGDPADRGLVVGALSHQRLRVRSHRAPRPSLVVGAGPVGLELAQAFRRLGAAVTVLDIGEPLAREDPECARIVLDQLARDGISLRSRVTIARVEADGQGRRIILAGEAGEDSIAGSDLLVATGRKPNLDGLNLDAGGIAFGADGIVVDRGLKTSNKRAYAIGDAAGGPQFTHAANYHAGLVVRNALFRLPVKTNDDLIPRVTYTDPELAHVGLTEADARKRGYNVIRVLRWPYSENDRAQAERDTVGHIKVVTSRRGRILGATIVGAAAGELITPWTLALSRGLNIRAIAGIVVPYPTLAEVGKRAAITYFTPGLTSPFVRRIIALLRRFG